eukprot:4545272-Amphidinium_carterae.1
MSQPMGALGRGLVSFGAPYSVSGLRLSHGWLFRTAKGEQVNAFKRLLCGASRHSQYCWESRYTLRLVRNDLEDIAPEFQERAISLNWNQDAESTAIGQMGFEITTHTVRGATTFTHYLITIRSACVVVRCT